MASTRLDGKMILWTATLVVLVGLISAFTLLRPPPGFDDPKVAQVAQAEPLAPKGREPASINRNVEFDSMSLGGKDGLQAVDLKIPCEGAQRTVFTQRVEQLRLKGDSCAAENNHIKKSSIQNAANGFIATVFFPSQKSFTTDYISLANGINRIVIKHHFTNGKVEEREYIVERELASTK